MPTCAQCGATLPPAAGWCTQCYLPVPAAAPAGELVGAYAGNVRVTPGEALSHPPPARDWPAPDPAVQVPAGLAPPAPFPLPVTLAPAGAADPAGRVLGRRAATLVALAIGLGGIVQLVALGLSHINRVEPDTLIRYDIVLTLVLYAGVAVMVVSQITPSVRLRWGPGPLLARIVLGLSVGAGLSAVLLYLVSAAAGHLQPDPRIVLMMSEGDPTHILVTVFISCVAAPLVEETLFRGLLLESLKPRGTRTALLISAVAFAAWHLMPAALVYYSALGLALGWLYNKRGLTASMSAHVGFNGVLVVAAISVVLGPAHQLSVDGLSLTAPSGWSQEATSLPGAPIRIIGPADATLDVVAGSYGDSITADALTTDLRNDVLPFGSTAVIDQSSVEEVTLPIGGAAQADVTADGRTGELLLVPAGGRIYGLLFMDAGSERAKTDFAAMLNSLRA